MLFRSTWLFFKEYLEQSLKNNQVLEIQLNTLDDFGRVQPPIVGVFEGIDRKSVV
nr:hypothetical protein [Enterococcus faecalis]